MQKNKLKEKLKQGKPCIGVWHEIGHPDIAEIQAMTGWEFMIYDMEHAPISLRSVQTMIQVADKYGPTPMIRVAGNDPVLIKQALDIGALGLIVPMVSSEQDAVQAVRSSRYPLAGMRGYGPRRASGYGQTEEDYFNRFAKEEILLFIQVETQEALDNLEAILSVEGIDGVFVGPNDLSISLGIRRQFDNPKFKDAIQLILGQCSQRKLIPACDGGGSAETLKSRLDMGFLLLPFAADTDIFAGATRKAFAQVKTLGI